MSSQNPTEQQRTSFLLFAVVSVFLLFFYKNAVWDQYFNPQKPAEQAPGAAATPAPANVLPPSATPNEAASNPATAADTESTSPRDEQVRSGGFIKFENDDVLFEISKLGGRVTKFELKHYRNKLGSDSQLLNLVEHRDGDPYPLGIYLGAVNDSWVNYAVDGPDAIRVSGNAERSVILRGELKDGTKLTKKLSFPGSGYLFKLSASAEVGPSVSPAPAGLEIEWTRFVPIDSETYKDPHSSSGYVWFDGTRASREQYQKLKDVSVQQLSTVNWVSVTDKYFATSIISRAETLPSAALHVADLYAARILKALKSGERTVAADLEIFSGPKSYEMLKQVGSSFELNMDLGLFAFLSAPLLKLLHLLFGIFGNYGLAIIALTTVVKLLLIPLNTASFRSMKSLQEIQPEIQRIRETVTEREAQQKALMELYQKKGVNPLGGCFPILVQIPIFIGLYTSLNLAVELRHAPFALWIHDLSAPEQLMIFGFPVPVMVVLLVISMLVQQWTTPTTMDASQKKLMLLMPLIFGFMFMGFPAGLTLYWLVNNFVSIGSTYALRRGGNKHAYITTSLVAISIFLFASVLVAIG